MNKIELTEIEPKEKEFVHRRGWVVIPSDMIERPDESLLRCLYSNLFPFAIEHSHRQFLNDTIKIYGYSPHFRILSKGEIIPEYQIEVKKEDAESEYEFSRFIEVK